jgi:V/A-type H+-transporting ATPase subunit K
MSLGLVLTVLGAALATILAGLGSILGVQNAGKAAAGVVSEQPELFGKLLVLQILPGTQGLYGFLVTIIVMIRAGLLGGTIADISVMQGWTVFCACLPIAINGLFSAIFQGKVATAAIMMTAKQPDASGKGITMAVLVETYAILSVIVSILLVLNLF